MKKSVRLFSVVLAVLMIVACATGCKDNKGGTGKDPNKAVSGELGLVLPNYDVPEGAVVKVVSHDSTALVKNAKDIFAAAYGGTIEVTQVAYDDVTTKFINSVLAEEAVKSAIADYYGKIGRPVDFEIEKDHDEEH